MIIKVGVKKIARKTALGVDERNVRGIFSTSLQAHQ
jgi:hypothetical protein